MTPTTIPFVDLKAQRDRIRQSVESRLAAVLEHGRFVMGPEVLELEEQLAEFSRARDSVAVASGSDALLMALLALEIGPGDAVLVPTFTFTATAEVVLLAGATPVFVDVDRDSFNIDLGSVRDELTRLRDSGGRARAVIAVDLFGRPAPWDELRALAAEENLALIDDAAQAFGASYKGRRLGGLGVLTATSFFPAKPLGCYGDGGALIVDDPEQAQILRSIRQHGEGENRYDIVRLGLNGRLDSMQAAVLLAKLEIFAAEVEERQAVASRYLEALEVEPRIGLPLRDDELESVWAQFTVRVGERRDAVRSALGDAGIPSAIYYPRPMHLQPAYLEWGRGEGSLPVAERLSEEVLSLPMHPYLQPDQQDRICESLISAVR